MILKMLMKLSYIYICIYAYQKLLER